jgi:hypothetical protein
MIWAASTFNNELDVLEIRLRTLDPVVDRFVLAEATVTQRGNPKPLYFQENKARFEPWLDKIEHVIVEDMPPGKGPDFDWARERWQRNALERGLGDVAQDDSVLISDLDEIPYPEQLEQAIATLRFYQTPTKFLMDMFVYRLNWRWLDRGSLIGSTAAVVCGWMVQGVPVHQALLAPPLLNATTGVAGWHLSYMGDVAHIRNKMVEMADNFYEQLIPEGRKGDRNFFLTDEWIQGCIDTGRDLYAREYRPSEWVGLEAMPPCVQEDPDRFAHLMVPEPSEPIAVLRCTCGGFYDDAGTLCHFPKCEIEQMKMARAE